MLFVGARCGCCRKWISARGYTWLKSNKGGPRLRPAAKREWGKSTVVRRPRSVSDHNAQRNREIVRKHVTRGTHRYTHTHTHTHTRTQHRHDDTFDQTLSFLLSYRERVDFQYRSLPPCFARLTIPPAPFATSSSKRELAAASDSRDESIVVVSSRARSALFFPLV